MKALAVENPRQEDDEDDEDDNEDNDDGAISALFANHELPSNPCPWVSVMSGVDGDSGLTFPTPFLGCGPGKP